MELRFPGQGQIVPANGPAPEARLPVHRLVVARDLRGIVAVQLRRLEKLVADR